jgi:hypothetical protein
MRNSAVRNLTSHVSSARMHEPRTDVAPRDVRGVVVDLQVKLATWAEAILFEVKTLHYSDTTGALHQGLVLVRTGLVHESGQRVVQQTTEGRGQYR